MRRLCTAVVLAIGIGIAAPAAIAQQDDSVEALLVEAAKRAVAAKNYRRAGKLLDRALTVNPRRIDAYVLRASVHAMRKQYKSGIVVMRRAQKLAPANPDVLTALGSQLMLAGQRGEAVALLERVVITARKRYDAQVVLGHYYIKRKQWHRASLALAAYFAARPTVLAKQDPTHRAALAKAHLRLGDPARALRLYRRVLSADPRHVAGRLGAAWATAAISCRRALPALVKLDDLASRYPSILMVRGRCALLTKDPTLALALANRYLKQRGKDPHGWALLGEARQSTGKLLGARQAFASAVSFAPQNKRWSFRLAQLERMSGAPAMAAARLRTSGPIPGHVDDWTMELGEALYASQQYRALRRLLVPWVATKPKMAQARGLLGLALFHLGRTTANRDAAVPHLQAALTLDPRQVRVRPPLVTALVGQAVAAFRRKDYAVAESRLTSARKIEPTGIVLRNLGAVLIKTGKSVQAVGVLRAALAKTEDRPTAFLLGRAHRLAKQYKPAIAVLQRARALLGGAPSSTALVLEIAAARLDAGTYGEAVAVLAKALRTAAGADKAKLDDAYYAAARQAATRWLSVGAFLRAYRLLLKVERRLPRLKKLSGKHIAVLCDLALAATGAGYRDTALRRLRGLRGVTCPFPSPANRLAIPILLAWNEGLNRALANRSLKRLEAMRRRAVGVAVPLVRTASRDVALGAGLEAYRKGQLRRSRAFLNTAGRIDRRSREVVHNQGVLLLSGGKLDLAIARFKSVAPWVPLAHVNLGIAYHLKGKPALALEHFRRARKAGVGFAQLAQWIATKQRIWGLP